LDDLRTFRPRLVLKRGAEPLFTSVAAPEWARQTVHIAPVDASSFALPAGHADGARTARVIQVIPGQLLTASKQVEIEARDGQIIADPNRDLIKIAVVERHHASGRIGIGLATNIGLEQGAFASTVAHDAHNIVALGVDDEDIACCVQRLARLGGGLAVAAGGRIQGELALPVAGLMSDLPLDQVCDRLQSMEWLLRSWGVFIESPFMCLSFLALSVIPELKITDRGLIDVLRFEKVSLLLD
jgi:adenine deaminase